MTEQQLATNFKNLLFKKCTKDRILGFYYKIPDTKGIGGLKPFDSFLLVGSKFFAIEFKTGKRELLPHQEYHLKLIRKCGGIALVIREDNYKGVIDGIVRGAITTRNLMSHILSDIRQPGLPKKERR